MKVLAVVDDNESDRELIRRAVARVMPDATILEAENGEVALRLIADERPGLVILDLEMPVVDGFGVLFGLQQSTHRPPVVVLSSSISDADRVRAEQLGAEAYYVKPSRFRHLVTIIREVITLHLTPNAA